MPKASFTVATGTSRTDAGASSAAGKGRFALAAGLCLLTPVTLLAQSASDSIGDLARSATVGAAYAQMLNLSANDDFSAARYTVDAGLGDARINLFRAPSSLRPIRTDSNLWWRVAGGYLRMENDFPLTDNPSGLSGEIDSKWTAYSVTFGLASRHTFGNGFELIPGIDFALARLENKANYVGDAALLEDLLNGVVFNWRSNATLVTPNVALEWRRKTDERRLLVRGHVARSWISSFDESAEIVSFNEAANTYSVRVEHAAPTHASVLGKALDWVAFGGVAGMFGANRGAIGFDTVAELGLAIETPAPKLFSATERMRLGASYLFGPDVSGWTIGFNLQY